MSHRPSESISVRLFYDLLSSTTEAAKKAAPMIALVRQEAALFLDMLPDDGTRITVLQARLTAYQSAHQYPAFVEYIEKELSNTIFDGFRKWEEHAEIMAVIDWLNEQGIDFGNELVEQDYSAVKEKMEAELVKYYYAFGVVNDLQSEIWKLEGKMAMAAGYKVSSGLKWNITGKSPYTKTDFENLMSALWEKKFITHISDRKEQAMKALYGVFDMPIPEKTGTNRHKNKSAGTTSDKTLEIFERLKEAQQQYLDSQSK